jgi:LPXTG-motif cell wall-anchored protein
VTISVAGGATVVIRDADGDVVGTFTEDGSVTVPEGATYTWAATPNEGFEFPSGAETSGSITIETCSTTTDPPDEVESDELPLTGVNSGMLAAIAALLIASGMIVLHTRRSEES